MKVDKTFKWIGIDKDGTACLFDKEPFWSEETIWLNHSKMQGLSNAAFSALANAEEFKPGQLYKIDYENKCFVLVEEKL